jgi:serine/threonine-protein kinase HipA
MIEFGNRKFIAKFSSSTDTYNVVKGEYIAMRLAGCVGLNVAPVLFRHTTGKDVLLIERFDRVQSKTGWQRRLMVSALTIFGLDEMMARYASYEDLADIIRQRLVPLKRRCGSCLGDLFLTLFVVIPTIMPETMRHFGMVKA